MQGTLATPDSTASRLGAASCVAFSDISFATTYYDAYTLRATAGMAYIITARAPDTSFADFSLALFGSPAGGGGEQFLTGAYDNGVGTHFTDPQLYVVTSQPGTYTVHVEAYTPSDTNLYTLTVRSCPVRARITGTAAFTDNSHPLRASDCVLNQPATNLGDSVHMATYTVHMEANTQRVITVSSTDFPPSFWATGPSVDATCTFSCTGFVRGFGSTTVAAVDTLKVGSAGDYTITVVPRTFAQLGAYTLTVGAAQPATVRRVAP